MNRTNWTRSGFTLIELIIVIAILSFVTMVGIHSYGNLKEVQAKKVNLANIKRIHNSLQVYEEVRTDDVNRYNYFDALVDAKEGSGAWTGAAGTYVWDSATLLASETCGIYDGSWKFLRALANAVGTPMKSASDFTVAGAKEDNRGTSTTGLNAQLGLYHLSAADAELLQAAGIKRYCLHNPSTGQSSSYAPLETGVQSVGGGGPGFRPDMSAYYPADIVAGAPVAIIRPLTSSRGSVAVNTIYKDFGYIYTATNTLSATDSDQTAMLSTLGVRLVAFGIGPNAEAVRNQFGLGEAPVDPVFTKRDYRYYIAVFALKSGGQGVAGSCHLAGVLDAAGHTYRAAEYDNNWTNDPN